MSDREGTKTNSNLPYLHAEYQPAAHFILENGNLGKNG